MKKLFSVPEIIDHIAYANNCEEAIEIISKKTYLNNSYLDNELVREITKLETVPHYLKDKSPIGWDKDDSSVEEIFNLISLEKDKMNHLPLGTRIVVSNYVSNFYNLYGTIVDKTSDDDHVVRYLIYIENCATMAQLYVNEIKLLENM